MKRIELHAVWLLHDKSFPLVFDRAAFSFAMRFLIGYD
ncbi:hypothetical protein CHCC20375_1185 [Bacillus licheniformis]|nr:hypothetical protein CHCC20375_1185 [Bacillus licheniformis]